jgi:hypothetical protein
MIVLKKTIVLKREIVPRKKMGFDAVREIGLALPGVEESTMYGKPALKVRGKLLTCIASHRSAEPGSLVVLMDFDQRDALIADSPEVYYLKDHYVNYPSVLVRLSRIDRDALRDLLQTSWRFVTARSQRAGTRKRKAKLR